MATVIIHKRKRERFTSYIVYYKDPRTAKKKYHKTCRKYKEAQKVANELRNLIDRGQIAQVERSKVKISLMTFSEVSDSLRELWDRKHRRKELSDSTIQGYLLRLGVLERTYGKLLLGEITHDIVLELQESLLISYSPANSNRYLFILKQVFKHGLEIGAISTDPVKRVKYLNENGHERNQFLIPTQINELVQASQQTRAKHYMPALIYLGAEHGASRQEALSLQWDDIDFSLEGKGTIRLYRTKNRNERTEFLMPRTKQSLQNWKKHLEWMRQRKRLKVKEHRFVFCRLDGSPIKRFDNAWRSACRIAGFKNFHYHDLRHTFCSNLIMSGSDLKQVKDMIGHRDLSMTDRYTHLTNLHKSIIQSNLAQYYEVESGV